jgi:hypothetical protein
MGRDALCAAQVWRDNLTENGASIWMRSATGFWDD